MNWQEVRDRWISFYLTVFLLFGRQRQYLGKSGPGAKKNNDPLVNYNNLERRRTAGVRIKPRAPNRKQKLSMTTIIKSKVLRQSLPPGSE